MADLLIERLLGAAADQDANPKIPIDPFQALMGQYARAAINAQQAQDAIAQISANNSGTGVPLTPAQATEAGQLVGLINGASGQANKLAVTARIRDVLMLAETGCLYTTPALVRTALGI